MICFEIQKIDPLTKNIEALPFCRSPMMNSYCSAELYPIYIKLSYKPNQSCMQINQKNIKKKVNSMGNPQILKLSVVSLYYLFILLRKINITSDSVIQMTYWKEWNTFQQIIK